VQIGETCHPDNPVELITHVALEGAHESDHNALIPFLEDTHARGIGPATAFADTAYNSGENLLAAAEKGVDLMAPTPGTVDPDDLTLANFTFQEPSLHVLACPEGHGPMRQGPNRKADGRIVRFNADGCAACECADICPAGKNAGALRFTDKDFALALSRAREQTPEFKKAYKIRSGIEATNAALKIAHGLAKLWTRGKARVSFAVLFKVLALNFKRYARLRCAQLAAVPC
jgi:ferredoxin